MEAVREKLKTGEWKLKKHTDRKSKVWELFSEVVKGDDASAGFVMCTSCDTIYTFDSHKTGTTNMARHKCGTGKPSQPNRITSPQTLDAFMRADHKKIPLQIRSKLVDDCVDFCCTDLRPFDIVLGVGFTTNAVIPHRQTVCDRAKNRPWSRRRPCPRF